MFTLVVTEKGGSPKRMEFDKDEITIGRVAGNDIVLPKGNVSKRHSRVVRQDGRYFVVDLKSTNGTYLNGRRITTPSVVRPGDKIFVGDFVVSLDNGNDAALGADELVEEADAAELLDSSPAMPTSDAPPAMRDSLPDSRGDSSIVEALPLDQEPVESSPPPAMPRSGAPGPSSGRPSAPSPSSSQLSPAGGVPIPNRPTQPPPARAPLARPTVPSVPAIGRATIPSITATRPSSPAITASPASSPAPAPAPAGPGPAIHGRSTREIVPPGGAAPSATDALRRSGSPSTPPSAPSAPDSRSARASTPPASTLVETVLGARALGSDKAAGASYAMVLAEVIAEASTTLGNIGDNVADAARRARVRAAVDEALAGRDPFPEGVAPADLARDAVAELAGTGPFETALDEVDTRQVTVDSNGRVQVFDRDGRRTRTLWFSSSDAIVRVLDRWLKASGSPRGDAATVRTTLRDGTRVSAVFPPLAATGAIVTVERGGAAASLADRVSAGALPQAAAQLLAQALLARRNIVVSGPSGSGRSTMLASLATSIAPTDRCVALDASGALGALLTGVSVIAAGGDWAGAVSAAMQARPQRWVVDGTNEATAPAIVGMMVTGSDGVLCTTDGASPAMALGRLASLAATPGGATRDEVLGRFAGARPLVVQLARLGDGSVCVAAIAEANTTETGALRIDALFALKVAGTDASGRLDASLAATGTKASFAG